MTLPSRLAWPRRKLLPPRHRQSQPGGPEADAVSRVPQPSSAAAEDRGRPSLEMCGRGASRRPLPPCGLWRRGCCCALCWFHPNGGPITRSQRAEDAANALAMTPAASASKTFAACAGLESRDFVSFGPKGHSSQPSALVLSHWPRSAAVSPRWLGANLGKFAQSAGCSVSCLGGILSGAPRPVWRATHVPFMACARPMK